MAIVPKSQRYTLVGHFARQYYTLLLQMGNYNMAHPQLYKS